MMKPWTGILCAWLAVAAADAGESARFIFLIEKSARMAPRHEATVRAVGDLARTGIHERAQPGEPISVWLFDDLVQTNGLELRWSAAESASFGDRIRRLIEASPYQRVTRPNRALGEASALLASTQNLTLFLLTDGAQALTGTPFDAEINGALASHRERFAQAQKPFLITLLGRGGQWVAYGVHTNLEASVELPVAPLDPAMLERLVAMVRAAGTNPAPTVASSLSTPPLPVATPKNEPVAAAKPTLNPTPPTARTEPTPTPAPKPVAVVEKQTPTAPPDPELAAKPEQTPPATTPPPPAPPQLETPKAVVPETKPAPEPAPLTPAPRNEAPASAAPPPSQPEPAAIPSPAIEAVAALGSTPQQGGAPFPWKLLLGLCACIAVAGALLYRWMIRPARTPRSLISRSLGPPDDRMRR